MEEGPFVAHQHGMRHGIIDMATLERELNVGRLLKGSSETAQQTSSPYHLLRREKLSAQYDLFSEAAQPVDLFVWGQGEAPDRAMTKVGGLPYLRATDEWPELDGPATFLAQFNFEDSHDIARDLPGEVLLVFVEGEDFFLRLPSSLKYRWERTDDARRVAPDDCPGPAWKFVTAYGVRHRSREDPSGELAAFRAKQSDVTCFPVVNATKIGGYAYDPQVADWALPNGARFLCGLASILPIPRRPWPWVNRKKPLELGFDLEADGYPGNKLSFLDAGFLNLFLLPDGKIHVEGVVG